MSSRRRLLITVMTAFALIGTAACASPDDHDTTDSAAPGSGFPAVIDTALGSVTVPRAPARVVTIGWGSQDAALALGVVPVGMQDMSDNTADGSGVLPWDGPLLKGQKPTLLDYTTRNAPVAEIAALHPDVILAVNSGLTKDEFDTLSEIAPTVAYPGKPWLTSWQDQIRMVGKALGKTAQAAELERRTTGAISRSRAQHPEFSGKTAAFVSATTTQNVNQYLTDDSRVQLLTELGFATAPGAPTTAPSFAAQIGLENLDQINGDVLVAWYLTPAIRTQIEKSAVFGQIAAVRRHGYVALTDPAMVYATSAVTVLSLPWMLERYLPMLGDAANGRAA